MSERYSFIMHSEDGTVLSLSGNKITLDEIIENFKAFLKGCEFSESLVEQIGRDESFGDLNDGN